MIDMIKKLFQPFMVVFSHVLKSPHTIKYPYERLKFSPNFRGRHLLDVKKCVGCGMCARICPNNCIVMIEVEKGKVRLPQINLGSCSFCALCVRYCPHGALTMTDLVEISTDKRENLIYPPMKLAEPPSIKNVLPQLKKELTVQVTRSKIKYIRRKI